MTEMKCRDAGLHVGPMKFTVPAASRLMLLVCTWVVCFLIASLLVGLIGLKGMSTPKIRIAMVVQDVVGFILPTLITAVMITRRPADFLQIRRVPRFDVFCLVVLILVVSAPAMNLLIAWNEGLSLPPSMSEVSEWMRASEASAAESMRVLIGGSGVSSLVAVLLIVAVMAGLSEEIFFRGGLQRILVTFPVNKHVAIWLTAVLFSAVHLQFFGFFPRLLLGAFFGYLAVWSGSLWLPIFAHVVNNAIAGTMVWMRSANGAEAALNQVGRSGDAHDVAMVAASVVLTLMVLWIIHRRLR